MSLREPGVVGLAGIEPEWPGTGLAGMSPVKYAEICNYMPKVCNHKQAYGLCANLQKYPVKYAEICNYMPKVCNYKQTYGLYAILQKYPRKYAKICIKY